MLGDILREVDDVQAVCQLLEPRIVVLERVSLPDVVLRGSGAVLKAAPPLRVGPMLLGGDIV